MNEMIFYFAVAAIVLIALTIIYTSATAILRGTAQYDQEAAGIRDLSQMHDGFIFCGLYKTQDIYNIGKAMGMELFALDVLRVIALVKKEFNPKTGINEIVIANAINKYKGVKASARHSILPEQRFRMPEHTDIINFAVLFHGQKDETVIANTVGCTQLILDRLQEHGDITFKSKKEIADEKAETNNN